MTEEEWLASVEATALEDEPWWLGEEDWDPASAPEECGGAEASPGEPARRAAPFASGSVLDDAAGCPALAAFADDAAGPDDSFGGASDDELLGVLRAWGRLEAHMAARKYAAIAELARRRPPAGRSPESPARVPTPWDEFAASELAGVLAESRSDAAGMLGLAHDLAVRLPATRAALRDGTITLEKAEIIAHATAVLDEDETRKAEAMVLGRAGQLTPEGLRSAIARAVIAVNPEKAKNRRERGARQARVERWAEPSGNAALVGRELPPASVLAADQKVSAWARELRKAGLEGCMDALRAQAYLDLLLGTDSRPLGAGGPDGPGQGGLGDPAPSGPGTDGGGTGPGAPAPVGPVPGTLPAGFAGRVNLTVPLATLLGLAERPGELPGLGPIDPALARDLARAAARNPRTTWCVTVTDSRGHAIGHGCAKPAPRDTRKHHGIRQDPPPPGGPAPPGFALTTIISDHGLPGADGDGGYGTWRLTAGTPGQPHLIIALAPLATHPCDHRFQARGHAPGVMLRHLTQIRYATCTGPGCRRPSARADFEHNVPYEAGGPTCLCNGNPKCRFDHRMKQDPRWKVDQRPDGTLVWTAPSGRRWTAEPTRHPI